MLYHTSPAKIEKASTGRFGNFIFFSSRVYAMSAGDVVVYSFDDSPWASIEARAIFRHADAAKLSGLVAEFCERFSVDEEAAEDAISERVQLDLDADDSWEVQSFTARAASILGYSIVTVSDEQGAAYMVDISEHFDDMKIQG